VFQINARKAEVHRGQFAGFVHGDEQPPCFSLVPGFQALEAFGLSIEGVVNALPSQKQLR
jgi:hypothetical protein